MIRPEQIDMDMVVQQVIDSTSVTTITDNVNNNTDNITSNTSNITANTTNIGTNTSDISSINSSITSINSSIGSISSDVSTNTSSISTINTTLGGMSSHGTEIDTNTSNISTLTTLSNSNKNRIDTNVFNIGNNENGVNRNSGNIGILTNLNTDVKSNLVSGLNEIHDQYDTHKNNSGIHLPINTIKDRFSGEYIMAGTNISKDYNVTTKELTISLDITDTEILNKIKNVDGIGSGLNADFLDGKSASAFQLAGVYNTQIGIDKLVNASGPTVLGSINTTDGVITQFTTRSLTPTDIGAVSLSSYSDDDVLNKIKLVDGIGSGLHADLLDGQHGYFYNDYSNLTNKPSPEISLIGDATGSLIMNNLTGGEMLVTVVDDSHNHIINNVDGLQTALDSKSDNGHGHIISDTTGLQTALDSKSDNGHGHIISDTTGLQSALDSKTDNGHSHTESDITDLQNYTLLSSRNIANGYAGLDSNAKVPLIHLPDLAKSKTTVLSSAETRPTSPIEGDKIFETDTGDSFIFDGTTWILMSDADWENVNVEWSNIVSKPSPVITLGGDLSGSVTLSELGSGTLTATISDDSHNHIIANIDGLQTALNGKQAIGTYNTIIGTDADINTSGATIIDSLTMTDGVITSHGTRTLTLANLGYTGATNANYYTHPTYTGDDINIDTGHLSGATVVDDIDINITTNAYGHVTDANAYVATRNLTYGDIGAAASSHTHDSRYFTESESDARFLNEASNLSDLTNKATARSNLEIEKITVSTTAPSGPATNDIWIDISGD